jgi:hypothetical protein
VFRMKFFLFNMAGILSVFLLISAGLPGRGNT